MCQVLFWDIRGDGNLNQIVSYTRKQIQEHKGKLFQFAKSVDKSTQNIGIEFFRQQNLLMNLSTGHYNIRLQRYRHKYDKYRDKLCLSKSIPAAFLVMNHRLNQSKRAYGFYSYRKILQVQFE